MNEILFAPIKEGARVPKKRDEDAGYDIYACFDEPYFRIAPHETVLIPTGLISAFPKEYVAILKERGSTGSRGFGQRAGVIDSGYRGEWVVALTNHNDRPAVIVKKEFSENPDFRDYIVYPYDKAICQAVFVPIAVLPAREAAAEEILSLGSERGEGKLGSSGK